MTGPVDDPIVSRSFAAPVGLLKERMDPGYVRATAPLKERLSGSPYPLVPLGDVAVHVQYGTSARATRDPLGVPCLRMSNLKDDTWDLTDLKYVDEADIDLEVHTLQRGDLLFNRTNSKELVGKCAVFDEPGVWVFASYLIRVRLDQSRALPRFVALFLATPTGRAQIDRVSRQIIGMANVNTREIRDFLVPLPPVETQRQLLAGSEGASERRVEMIARANSLESSVDPLIAQALQMSTVTHDSKATFGVRGSALLNQRFDARSHRPPTGVSVSPYPSQALGGLADIGSRSRALDADDDTLVPYVGLPECDQTSVRSVTWRPYSEVKGRNVAEAGDILFARIEPSVFNKKYVLVEEIPDAPSMFVSNEFHVITANAAIVDPMFLYAQLFTTYVAQQVEGKTTGSSGRRRIDRDMLASITIPVPPFDLQREIAREAASRWEEARRLRRLAEGEWKDAKSEFEARLLGGATS